ncbi:MAG: murein hydrolase activator EnvC family protein [Acidimicrobiales bacterium]
MALAGVVALGAVLIGSPARGDERAMAGLAETVAAAPVDGDVLPSGLGRQELRLRIDLTTKDLNAATTRLTQLDQGLAVATGAAADLEVETDRVGEQTLQYAIRGYQRSELPVGLFETDDLVDSMRADTLETAALSADTAGFDAYRDLRKDLEIQQAEVVERQGWVAEANVEVADLQTRLNQETVVFGEMEERRIQASATALSVQASNRAQVRGRRQGYYLDVCPVAGPHNFINSWGFARSGGRRHQGVDILASVGTPIVAPVSGRVEHYSNSLGGRSFRLFGPNGLYLYGTHMSGFAKQGDVVAGEVIGYVGDDGNAAGIPHLHFEIHPGGQGSPAVNPFADSAAVCSGAQY